MKTNGWRREHGAKGTQIFFFYVKSTQRCGLPISFSEEWPWGQLQGSDALKRDYYFGGTGAGRETQCPPAWLLLSFISSHCDKSHFNLLELDVDPERACCQLHEGLGVGSCVEESEALECADSAGRHRCLCF